MEDKINRGTGLCSCKTIALLVPRLYNGGGEKIAADMSIFLHRAGYRVLFFLDEFNRDKCYEHKGKEIVIDADSVLNRKNGVNQLYHYLRRAEKYKQYKQKYKVDISISFMVEENLTNIMSDVGDKKILTLHAVTSLVKEFQGFVFVQPWILRWLYPKADSIVAVSKSVKWDLVNRIGLHRGNIEVIYNSIKISRLRKCSEESIDLEQDENLILFVGRLDDDKRPWIAVRIMQEVVRNVGDAKLLILGKGENKNLLLKLIKKFHLEQHVQLIGFQDNVARYMARAKVLILCSETEGFACVLAEAMALGLPAVANDCPGGIREVLSSKNIMSTISCKENAVVDCGVITPFITTRKEDCNKIELNREEKMFAQGICNLLENSTMRKCLSQNAVVRSEAFSQERIAKQWINLLESL